MTDLQTLEALEERVKELTCLYDISTIAAEKGTLQVALQAIVNRVALAWRYADKAVAEIVINDKIYRSGQLPVKSVYMAESVFMSEKTGRVSVHYPSPEFNDKQFLVEEGQLLKKVAQEISALVDRFAREEKEALLKRTIERNDRLSILGEITAGIAHELNTPLGNILGFSELIAENTNNDQVASDAQKITASAMYAREVVKKLMFFSCDMPQQNESIALNPLVEDALKLMHPKLQSAGISIQFLPDPKNAFGRLDPIQLTQVIFNLLLNAVHASPKGSTITVQLNSQPNELILEITDQGHGIPAQVQAKIFEPFFSTKGVGAGSGLGLSVVHGIVKSHKGTITFVTEKNKGTTFFIRLPKHS